MADEIELKLALPPSAQHALLRHPLLARATRLGTKKLTNVYFDTPELALHRHAIALRTRKQGRRWLQTVKCAGSVSGGLAVRPEWEQPYDGHFDFSAVDDRDVREVLERRSIGPRLAPVFETVFSRTIWRLTPRAGSTVLLMLDRGWIEAGEAREVISEIELELEAGDAAALFEPALALAADLPLRPALLSKAERGFRLRRPRRPRPVKAGASPLREGQSPREAFRAVAAECIGQLQWNELGLAEDDPEFIHQMRVALRRLRSALRTFRPALPPAWIEAAVPPIRALARQLGAARDRDVLATEIVAPALAAFPADPRLAALAAALEEERRRARGATRAALAAPDYGRFILVLTAQLHGPAEADVADADGPGAAMQTLPGFAARRLTRLHRKALALAEAARDLEPGRLHALRIGAKRLRYALEFFAPLYRARDVKRAVQALTRLQDTLGALNDLAGAGAPLIRRAAGDPALREAIALVGGWHGPRYEALRAELPGRIGALLALKRFWRG